MRFSVLMSIYYKEKPDNFAQCMDSLLTQTSLPDEIVLVEDGRLTDELYNVLPQAVAHRHTASTVPTAFSDFFFIFPSFCIVLQLYVS